MTGLYDMFSISSAYLRDEYLNIYLARLSHFLSVDWQIKISADLPSGSDPSIHELVLSLSLDGHGPQISFSLAILQAECLRVDLEPNDVFSSRKGTR